MTISGLVGLHQGSMLRPLVFSIAVGCGVVGGATGEAIEKESWLGNEGLGSEYWGTKSDGWSRECRGERSLSNAHAVCSQQSEGVNSLQCSVRM